MSISVSIFDSTADPMAPTFMGGVHIYVDDTNTEQRRFESVVETSLADWEEFSTRYSERAIQVADRTWIVAVVAQPATFEPTLVFVILGGTMIMLASIFLAIWYYTNMGRVIEIQRMMEAIEADKAANILENARQQASAERQLNEVGL